MLPLAAEEHNRNRNRNRSRKKIKANRNRNRNRNRVVVVVPVGERPGAASHKSAPLAHTHTRHAPRTTAGQDKGFVPPGVQASFTDVRHDRDRQSQRYLEEAIFQCAVEEPDRCRGKEQ